MKQVVRLLAILILLLAARAVPSSAIIPNCDEFCSCETACDWGCWDKAASAGTNCGDWGICGAHCGAAASGTMDQDAWLRTPGTPTVRPALNWTETAPILQTEGTVWPAWARTCR